MFACNDIISLEQQELRKTGTLLGEAALVVKELMVLFSRYYKV